MRLRNMGLEIKEWSLSLATLAAECSLFKPVNEKPSRFSTSPSKKTPGFDFSAYEGRKDLGNVTAGDGGASTEGDSSNHRSGKL